MLTSFGIELRKLRIERQELLKDMADALGVSSAYLSAVETGKRRIPQGWISRIAKQYSLDNSQIIALQNAADNSTNEVTIPLEGFSQERKDAVLSFARSLDGISDAELTAIMNSMKKKNGKRGD